MPETNSTNNGNKTMSIVLAILAILALVGVGSYLLNRKDDNNNNNSNSSMMSSDSNKGQETVSVGGAAMYKNKNIIDNVVNAPNLSTLVTAVKAADLVETLKGDGPFTVFGPDNDAFAKLPAGTVDTLLKPENKEKLKNILTYHVVQGTYKTSDLKEGQVLKTVNGQSLTVKKSGNNVMINGAMIKTPDVLQSNGVAHVIDSVMIPDEISMVGGAAMYKSKTLAQNVVNAPNLTTLVTAVKAAGLVDTLNAPGPFTVFGPDNDAFAKLPSTTIEDILKPENKAKLVAILTYHVVPGTYKVADLKDGQELTTVQGQKLKITKKDGKTMINDATITTPDVMQSNGIAHVVDTVLMPIAK